MEKLYLLVSPRRLQSASLAWSSIMMVKNDKKEPSQLELHLPMVQSLLLLVKRLLEMLSSTIPFSSNILLHNFFKLYPFYRIWGQVSLAWFIFGNLVFRQMNSTIQFFPSLLLRHCFHGNCIAKVRGTDAMSIPNMNFIYQPTRKT